MKVAIATCSRLPEPDVDEEPLVRALEARGMSVRLLAWDGDTIPETGEVVVLRSTWNYYENVEGFAHWVSRTATTNRLLNPAAIVQANAKKTYLRDLEERGIDIVPTEWAM